MAEILAKKFLFYRDLPIAVDVTLHPHQQTLSHDDLPENLFTEATWCAPEPILITQFEFESTKRGSQKS